MITTSQILGILLIYLSITIAYAKYHKETTEDSWKSSLWIGIKATGLVILWSGLIIAGALLIVK